MFAADFKFFRRRKICHVFGVLKYVLFQFECCKKQSPSGISGRALQKCFLVQFPIVAAAPLVPVIYTAKVLIVPAVAIFASICPAITFSGGVSMIALIRTGDPMRSSVIIIISGITIIHVVISAMTSIAVVLWIVMSVNIFGISWIIV